MDPAASFRYASLMAETVFLPDRGLAQATAALAAAGSLSEVVTILKRTARAIAGSDGIAVVLREGDTSFYVAEDAIERVKASGAQVEMEPMNPFERKVVHDVVAAAGLVSESDGQEPYRYVVVRPA